MTEYLYTEWYGLGYELLDKYNHVIDIAVRKEGDTFTVIQPVKPTRNLSKHDLYFFDLHNQYLDRDGFVRGQELKRAMIDSDGREYIAMVTESLGKKLLYRIHEFDNTGNEYVVRLHLQKQVQSVSRDTETPTVFYNDEGDMELEEGFVENMINVVEIGMVTTLDTFESHYPLQKEMQEIVDKQEGTFINEIIKEVSDSEIALAVMLESENLG